MRSYYYRGSDSSLGNSQPEWGNLDILGACGASDSGSNPGSGVIQFSDSIVYPTVSAILPRLEIVSILHIRM